MSECMKAIGTAAHSVVRRGAKRAHIWAAAMAYVSVDRTDGRSRWLMGRLLGWLPRRRPRWLDRRFA
jgi:hypothetical protein